MYSFNILPSLDIIMYALWKSVSESCTYNFVSCQKMFFVMQSVFITGFYTCYYMDTLILITLTSVWLLHKETEGFFQEHNPSHFSREMTFAFILSSL